MPHSRARVAALVVAAALLFVAACGGGDDDSPTPSPDPTAIPTHNSNVPIGPGVTDTEIKIGITGDLGGAGDTPYAATVEALDAYLEAVNTEDGGVCGRDIVLVTADDAYAPGISLEATKKLVDQDQVLAVVGGTGTAVHQPVAAYLNDPNGDGDKADGVPDLFLSTGWSGWGDVAAYPWSVGFLEDYGADARILARYVNNNLADKRVGLLYQDDEFGQDYQAAFGPTLPSQDLFVEELAFAPDVGITNQVLRMQESGVEVVVLATAPPFTAVAFAAAQALAYTPQFLISYVNTPSGLASDIGGGTRPTELVAGFQALNGTVWTTNMLSPIQDEDTDPMIAHTRYMNVYAGPEVSTLSVYAQTMGELLVEALGETCDNLSRAGLMQAVERIDGFRPSLMMPGVQIVLSDGDHRAIETAQPVIIQADGMVIPSGGPIDVGP